MAVRTLDINCDVGESYGRYTIGNDEELIPLVTSCNIACGAHGGDPVTIRKTIALALDHGVRIGAHPSYPDRQGFGRRYIQMGSTELAATIQFQLATIKGLADSLGGKLIYVKPHGALYNRIAIDRSEALTAYKAIRDFDDALAVMGLAGSHCEQIARELHMTFIAEAFADRTYDDEGQLMSRSQAGSILEDPEKAADQALKIAHGTVTSFTGKEVPIHADSLCIHGDNPAAVDIARSIITAFKSHGIRIAYE